MWSTHDRLAQKPAYSRRSKKLLDGKIRSKIMKAIIFCMVLRGVIPRQFLQSLKSHFWGIVTMTPFLHPSGVSRIIGMRTVAVSWVQHLKSSAAWLNFPLRQEYCNSMLKVLTLSIFRHVGPRHSVHRYASVISPVGFHILNTFI